MDAPLTAADREAVKAELAALLRIVEHQTAEFGALREELKRAATRWRDLPARAAVEMVTATAPSAIARSDYLGASTFVEKGWGRIAREDYSGAEADLRHALTLAPDDANSEALLGWACMHQGRFDDALKCAHNVLRRLPEHAMARITIGYVSLKQGACEDAIEHLSRAIRESSDRKAILYANYYLGLAFLECERYVDAKGSLRSALQLGPNLAEAWYDLGRAHWLAAERELACRVWREGATSSKFSAWARRCADAFRCAEQGGEPLHEAA
jgi:tetratricopeptide (TPR) repeat protein